MENKITPQVEGLRELFVAFSSSGAKLYHVGGSVRDMMLGLVPKDFDFTTDVNPEKIKEILGGCGYKTFPLGERFGTISAHVGDEIVEITTHRRDLTVGRHPDVAFTTDLKEDLSRRDFTVNSMAMDGDGNIIDPFGGAKDLTNRIIKTTGSPMERFGEDPLRMLRAIRFVSKLGFKLDSYTQRSIYTSAQAIMNVSRERWLEELNKLLVGAYVGKALEILKKTRLLGYLLPEVFPITMSQESELPSKDLWHHTKIVVSKSKPTKVIRWAALLHDIAKPQTRQETKDEVHFFQHESVGAELVESVARRLHMANEMRRAIKGLVKLHQRMGDVVSRRYNPPVSVNALRRVARDCDDLGCSIEDLVELFAADSSSNRKQTKERQNAHADLLREAIRNMKEEDLRPKLPSGIGKTIMDYFQLAPGPEVGEIKMELETLLIDGKIDVSMSEDDMMIKLNEHKALWRK